MSFGRLGIAALLLVLVCLRGNAGSNNAVLPQGIWHPSIRYGVMSELANHYDDNGSLQSVGRLNMAFDGPSIAKNVPSFSKLQKLLDDTFPNSNYSKQLFVGALEFEADAAVQYTAPVLAYGLTKRLTVAAGVPIVNLKAQVYTYQTGTNNSRAVRNQISANGMPSISAELDRGFTELEHADLIKAYETALESKGYKVPGSVDKTVVGDAQLAAVYQYWEDKRWTLSEQTTLNLPTGPEDDPDDFIGFRGLHQTYLKFDFKQDYRMTRNWNVGSLIGYTWKISDTVEKRVPKDEEDILPDADRKERVSRNLGDIFTIGGSTNFWFTKYLNLGTGYDYNYESADVYSGTRGYNYSLLSRNTESDWHRVFANVTFSTVDMYMDQEFVAPFILTYTYSDIISAVNMDRQLTHELAFKMFF